jgi:lipopolysaccharide export system protein LptA
MKRFAWMTVMAFGCVVGCVRADEPAPAKTEPTASVSNGAPVSATATAIASVVEDQSASKQDQPMVVTSDRFQVDYAKNIGVFEGNVLAVDPRITVRADKMTVTFGQAPATGVGTNTVQSLQQIVAEGGVVISAGERKSDSDHAVYTAADGKVVLTGNPKVTTPDGTVSGKKITFWRTEEKMDVESGTQLIIYPDDKSKKEPKDEDGAKPENGKPSP